MDTVFKLRKRVSLYKTGVSSAALEASILRLPVRPPPAPSPSSTDGGLLPFSPAPPPPPPPFGSVVPSSQLADVSGNASAAPRLAQLPFRFVPPA